MSKLVIYILDKLVWMLIIAILTTQALQIAGILKGPKQVSLRELHIYDQDNSDYTASSVSTGERVGERGRRQAGDRSPLIDNLFNVPISTLNAVNEFIQSTRPVIQRWRDAAQRRTSDTSSSEKKQRQEKTLNAPASKKATQHLHDGPEVQADGSSSRVLLRV